MSSSERKEIIERVWISILIGLGKFLVSTIALSLLFLVVLFILFSFFASTWYVGLPGIVIVYIVPLVIGGIIGVRDGIRNYNHIAAHEIRQEYKKRISIYAKSATIGLVSGMLSSSFFGIILLSVNSIDDFFWILARSVLIGGFPSLGLAATVLALSKNARNNEKNIKLTCLITGLIVGALSMPFYAFGNF